MTRYLHQYRQPLRLFIVLGKERGKVLVNIGEGERRINGKKAAISLQKHWWMYQTEP